MMTLKLPRIFWKGTLKNFQMKNHALPHWKNIPINLFVLDVRKFLKHCF